jgi:formylglycine-generating enzyme required for sulfatase activity
VMVSPRTGAMVALAVLMAQFAAEAQEAARGPWLSPGTRVGEEIVGPNGGALVWVPAGSFKMGATDADVHYALGRLQAEGDRVNVCGPVHKVRIGRGFRVGKFEVTNAQYHRYSEAAGVEFRDKEEQGPNHPVRFVNWEEAVGYCRHYGLVLPTEAQWEYAARGPENRWFPWGNEWDSEKCLRRPSGSWRRDVAGGDLPRGRKLVWRPRHGRER